MPAVINTSIAATWKRAVIFAAAVLILSSCSDKPPEPPTPATDNGFTFLDMGAETRYSNDLRRWLKNELGSDAIARRTPIDLKISFNGFLEAYFPALAALNSQLNDARGARIEHDVVKLMYRYSQRKSRPFKFVELIFSNREQQPLFFKITADQQGAAIVAAMRQKYGRPQTIQWQDRNGSTLYWKHPDQMLLVSQVQDRFGNPEYHIGIYFIANLNNLIAWEQEQKAQAEAVRQKGGKSAF